MQGDKEGQIGGNRGAEEEVAWSHEHSSPGLDGVTEEPAREGRALSGWGAVVLVLQWLVSPSQH